MAIETRKVRTAKRVYRWLNDSHTARFNVLYGGASSAKSWSMALYLLTKKFLNLPGVGLLVCRKTKPAVRTSCWRLMEHWLSEMGVWSKCKVNHTNLTITAPNKSFIQFAGLDDVEKLKSVEGINYVWVEEATEVKESDIWQLHIRCRANNPYENNALFLTFNPVDPIRNDWLQKMTQAAPEGTYLKRPLRVLMVTYKDNPFLSEEERATIEGLADSDDEYDKIYRRGLWATPSGVIYDNWDIVEEIPHVDDYGYGLDFGYTNPTALIWCGIRDETDLYVREVLYETHLHNQELIGRLAELGVGKDEVIVADSSEPAYIDEIAAAGYNIHPCEKTGGQGDKSFVRTGINRVKRMRMHVHADSTHVIEELGSYKWRKTKDDDPLDEPVKFRDHSMDAIRYFVGSRPDAAETEVIHIPDWLRQAMENAM